MNVSNIESCFAFYPARLIPSLPLISRPEKTSTPKSTDLINYTKNWIGHESQIFRLALEHDALMPFVHHHRVFLPVVLAPSFQ
jgi:hypothetical protein